jgi:hypothetical protein
MASTSPDFVRIRQAHPQKLPLLVEERVNPFASHASITDWVRWLTVYVSYSYRAAFAAYKLARNSFALFTDLFKGNVSFKI